jgi:hypothetical protein
MPQSIKTIDEKGISLNRTMLYFCCNYLDDDFPVTDEERMNYLLGFCQQHNIKTEIIGPPSWSVFLAGGPIYVYVNVPYDENDANYQLLSKEFKKPDGSPKYPHCSWYFSIPGYWQQQRDKHLVS